MRHMTRAVVLCMVLLLPMVVSAQEGRREAKPIATQTIEVAKDKMVAEPTILELQRAAIRYAEVSPDKIRNWRRQVAVKALLPQVSVGYDKNTYRTINSSSNKGEITFAIGPDDLSYGWDLSLKWDLGDLVYNESQTSIDSRSKLMVQLRNDVLDRLNQAYFERKRLQTELSKIQDKQSPAHQERQLKIEELSAQIDALTGGYFSRHIRKE